MVPTMKQHPLDDLASLDRVSAGRSPLIDTVDLEELDADVLGFMKCAREGSQRRVVEPSIRIRDEGLVLAAVVPGEWKRLHGRRGLGEVEDRLEVVQFVLDVGV